MANGKFQACFTVASALWKTFLDIPDCATVYQRVKPQLHPFHHGIDVGQNAAKALELLFYFIFLLFNTNNIVLLTS
jgi:hypothetical protein